MSEQERRIQEPPLMVPDRPKPPLSDEEKDNVRWASEEPNDWRNR